MYQKKELIHSISFLSNAAYDIQASSFPTLQSETFNIVNTSIKDSGVKDDIGDCTLVWGPVVFSNDTTSKTVVADNTMMLVYNSDLNLFIVGIAGTNVVSTYGFFQEDFKVNNTVNWSDIVKKNIKNSGAIAEGTSIGLNILLQMTGGELTVDKMPVVDMITALKDYIKANNISGAELATTGHSLGGALAPVMAMYLQDTASSWNTGGNISTISAWPTAGPTAGNAAFATYVASQMGDNYQSFYNPLDVVPQAWQASTLELIPTLYKDNLDAPESTPPLYTPVGTLAVGASINRIHSDPNFPYYTYVIDYEQILPWQQLDHSSYNSDIQTALNNKLYAAGTLILSSSLHDYFPYLKFLLLFLNQMLYQHTKAYNTLLEISDFMDKFNAIKKSILGTTEEERREQAFTAAMKKYYNLPDLTLIAKGAEKQEA